MNNIKIIYFKECSLSTLSNQIYNELGENLKLFIYKHIKNEHDTEDLFQEVFIKIHNKITSLNDNSKLHSWVYQITRNTIIDFKRKKDVNLIEGDIPDLSYIETESDETLKLGLRIIINSLPKIYSEILILNNYENMKNKEISDKLNITASAVKSRLFRARKEFKNRLLEFCHFELDIYNSVIDYKPTDCFICYLKKINCKS